MNFQPTAGPALTNLRDLRALPRTERIDPYPLYRMMHDCAPVWQSDWGDTYIARHSDVSAVLRNRTCIQREMCSAGESSPEASMQSWVLFQNGETHSKLRIVLQKLMASVPKDRLTAKIIALAKQLINDIGDGSFCFVQSFAACLPVMVICDLIGIPERDRHQVLRWAVALREILDSGPDPQNALHEEALVSGGRYFEGLIDDPTWARLAFGGQAKEFLAALDKKDAGANLFLLVFAGHETTVHLIGSAMDLLIRNPGCWDQLQTEQCLIPNAVDEALRVESPILKLCRTNLEPLQLSGVEIAPGTSLVLLLGAANRDPLAFEEPDRFSLSRQRSRHLAFGLGTHLCIGQALALLEAQISLQSIVENWRGVRRVGQPERYANSSFLGLKTLPIERTVKR